MAPLAEPRLSPGRATVDAGEVWPRPRARPGLETREPAARRDRRTAERRRRERHLRLLRRDLLVDVALALALMIFILIVTAGLGVIALMEVPLGAAVIGSFVAERRRRRRSALGPPRRGAAASMRDR